MIGCIHLAAFLMLWIAAVIAMVVGIYYRFRARRFFRPQSFTAQWLNPFAKFQTRNFAPEAVSLVTRARAAVIAFACICALGVAVGRFGIWAGTTTCPNLAFNADALVRSLL